jgi:ubiquinone/menaquinone biosynthesis C-methylase UbiE
MSSYWDQRYKRDSEYRSFHPWPFVVAFVKNNANRKNKSPGLKILEVGCGSGNNLIFAAQEGHEVFGIDSSPEIINYAKRVFKERGLGGTFLMSDFTTIGFPDETFDLIFDRCSLTFASKEEFCLASKEISRVLKKDGEFLFNPLSDRCSSFDGNPDADGRYSNITKGSIDKNVNPLFYSATNVRELIGHGWQIKEMKHIEELTIEPYASIHAEWRIILSK